MNAPTRKTKMRCLLGWTFFGCVLTALVPVLDQSSAADAPYDLLIRNGKIVDGTGNPWFRGDVAVRGDKIVALGKIAVAPCRREIDAGRLVVAPGFIDMHSHSDYVLLEDGDAPSKIRQGVTTEVLGEGSSPGPFQGKLDPLRITVGGKVERWSTLGGYFDLVERRGISPNVASFVGLGTVWQCVMGDSFARPTPAQLEQMKALVEEAMKNGAAGLSSMLAMPPGSLATTDDIVELCKVVARYGGIYVTHVRHEGAGVFDAIKEAIEIGRRAGVAVEILHIKIADRMYWGRMNEIVKLVDDARKQGVNVGANIYPYTRGHNNLSSIIPPWAHEGGSAKMLARLKDPKDRARMKKDIRGGIPGWYNHFTAVGGDWSRMLVSAKGVYQGLTMDRILNQRVKGRNPAADALDELFDLLVEEGGSIPAIYEHHTEKDMRLAMLQPWCSIGSDGLAYATEGPLRRGHPHPRSFGTFPRVLGVYVRQLGVLRLEDAVRKMTSQNAVKLGLHDRGLIRPGLVADLALFDEERVLDRATYTDPFRYSEGIEYVIVNGQLVLDRGRHTGAKPGRALRHACPRPDGGANDQPVQASELEGDLSRKLKSARFELYAKAPGYSEGPTWRNGELFFCSGALLRVAKDGTVARFLNINPAGTVLGPDDHLFICDNKHRALLDLSPDGRLTVLADRFEGKPLRSLNDLTIDTRGNIYWTDPEGSSTAKPVGNIFRLRPDGVVSKVATGLAFPNGLDVDPNGRFLYVIESQSKKVLRYRVPNDDEPLGKTEVFFDLGGSGGDGCAFDEAGNFWIADFHRPETKRGRITVLSPQARILARLEVPARVVSNITFGGVNHDEIFCTTGEPDGVFRARVGTKGFRGHSGKRMKPLRVIPVAPNELASPVHPRRFGFPGGVGATRGWYIWRDFDRATWTAKVSHEATGEDFTVKVLPWATTYRHLVYGAHPDELLPGERVNLFFAPNEEHKRGYLVHFQDELCQMKGHGHIWELEKVADNDSLTFTARVKANGKFLDGKPWPFRLDKSCRHWRGGKRVDRPSLKTGEQLFLTWSMQHDQRLVHLTSDDASLEALRKSHQQSVAARLKTLGLGAHMEAIDGDRLRLLIFPTYWAQAVLWKEGQRLRIQATDTGLVPIGEAIKVTLLARRNLGTYGSGATEAVMRLEQPADARRTSALLDQIVRIVDR